MAGDKAPNLQVDLSPVVMSSGMVTERFNKFLSGFFLALWDYAEVCSPRTAALQCFEKSQLKRFKTLLESFIPP